MATRDKEWQSHHVDERGDRDAVLAVISSAPSITIEELLQQLPYMRWGYLFSILGECQKEGLVAFSHQNFRLEIETMPGLKNKRKKNFRVRSNQHSIHRRSAI